VYVDTTELDWINLVEPCQVSVWGAILHWSHTVHPSFFSSEDLKWFPHTGFTSGQQYIHMFLLILVSSPLICMST